MSDNYNMTNKNRISLLAIVLFVAANLFLVAFLMAELKPDESSIKINNNQVKYTTLPQSKVRIISAIGFSGMATIKTDAILEHHLGVEFETLRGRNEYGIGDLLSTVHNNKMFRETFLIDKAVPICAMRSSGKYFIITLPAERQRNRDIKFSEAEKMQLTDRYYFNAGMPAEQILFVEKEYLKLKKYIKTIEEVYRSIEQVVEESLENEKLPENNPVFTKWLKTSQEKVSLILAYTGAFPDANFLTYFPLTYDKMREACNRLVANFHAIEVTMKYAPQGKTLTPSNDPVSPVLIVNRRIEQIIGNEIKELLAKETIFNCSVFLHSLLEDFSDFYANIFIDGKGLLNDWMLGETLWGKALNEYDRFIGELGAFFIGLELWQKYEGILAEQVKMVKEQLQAYCSLAENNGTKAIPDEITLAKTKVRNIFEALRQVLK